MVKPIGININVEETVKSLKALYERTKEPIYLELYEYYNNYIYNNNNNNILLKKNKTNHKDTQTNLF